VNCLLLVFFWVLFATEAIASKAIAVAAIASAAIAAVAIDCGIRCGYFEVMLNEICPTTRCLRIRMFCSDLHEAAGCALLFSARAAAADFRLLSALSAGSMAEW
jgi:hypothetical protein